MSEHADTEGSRRIRLIREALAKSQKSPGHYHDCAELLMLRVPWLLDCLASAEGVIDEQAAEIRRLRRKQEQQA